MRKIFNKTVFVALCALLFVRCSDDDLNVSNPNAIDGEAFFNTVGDLELSLTGVYEALGASELYGYQLMPFLMYGLPKTGDQEWISDIHRNEIYLNEVTPRNALTEGYWKGYYRGISRANDFLENADRFLAENPDISTDDRNRVMQMRGEALFYRAFNYFDLIRLWGEKNPAVDPNAPGVPLFLNVPKSREEMNKDKSTVGEVYAQLEMDLMEAADLLPPSWSGANLARVDSYAAKALLGKVYVYQEKWDNAKSSLEEVINGPFSLVNFDNYDDLFHGKNEFSSESLFELNFSMDQDFETWKGGTGQSLALIVGSKGAGWNNNYPHDKNIERFGSDPRLRINMLEPGVDSVVAKNGSYKPVEKFWPDNPEIKGWAFRKYVPLDLTILGPNRRNYGSNFNLIRLADIYLLYAEVMNAQGNDAVAAEYANKVRRRAYGGNPNTPNPSVDFAGIGGTQLRDSIREERFRELFAEGHRWFDLQRWGIVQQELAKYGTTQNGPIIFDAKDTYLPIPQRELDANTALEQSTGY
ncbi:RagB/SusD family nutrient uptake outer membrane protein [Galbibacter mesophilus]|uniref:RagB/SusD family nutrient uptake outer membrane protein n=1 Tax=Galbibacter mesophilus TaxID=379069 RepID=UPI0019200040|nr:RagB/SusD family nutrient uptake outer membrane protein [Galbibacter mesophilus]MCM5663882.1 RagB/SusD family nutrient uptake outer membrane protein [Galbibacter mesophilus]